MEDLAVKPFPPIFYQSVISHKFAVVLFFFTKKRKTFMMKVRVIKMVFNLIINNNFANNKYNKFYKIKIFN